MDKNLNSENSLSTPPTYSDPQGLEESVFNKNKSRGNTLFQTIGIMLALFFPVFLSIKRELSSSQYNLFMLAQWFLFASFFASMIGFLFLYNPQWTVKHMKAWKKLFLFTPTILLAIALLLIAYVFSELEESLILVRYIFIGTLVLIALIFSRSIVSLIQIKIETLRYKKKSKNKLN